MEKYELEYIRNAIQFALDEASFTDRKDAIKFSDLGNKSIDKIDKFLINQPTTKD